MRRDEIRLNLDRGYPDTLGEIISDLELAMAQIEKLEARVEKAEMLLKYLHVTGCWSDFTDVKIAEYFVQQGETE